MRELENKFVGGIERIDSGLSGGRHGLSLRALVLGFVAVALLSVAEPYNQGVFQNTMLIGNQLPIAVVFLGLLLVLVVNPVLARLPVSSTVWDPARLALTWACLLPASLVMWRGPVDPAAKTMPTGGLAGAVVGLVWGLTGLLLVVGAILAHLRRKRGHSTFLDSRRADDSPWCETKEPRASARAAVRSPENPAIPDLRSDGNAPRSKGALRGTLLLAATCLLPVLLVPALSHWLDSVPASAGATALSIVARYALLTLALLAASAGAARWLRKVEPFSPAELVVMLTMLLAACGVIWSGFHRLWAHQLIAPFYHLASYPRWAPLVEALPSWLVPSSDPANREVIYNFYAGRSAVPWHAWWPVALRWAPFVLAFFLGSFFLMALLRRQWEESEKLSFPLATIILETLRPPPPGRLLNDMLRSKLFWWSTGIVVLLQTLYGLHVYYPRFPEVVFKYDLYAAFQTPPWRHLPDWIKAKDAFFAVVGVSFFFSTEMSFSLWASVIIMAIVEMVGKDLQYPIQDHFDDGQIGAFIAYAVVIVWVARRHLAGVFRSILSRRRPGDEPAKASERSAARGFLTCVMVAWIWLTQAGLPVHLAGLTTLVIFVLVLVIGRVVAESGLLFVQYNCLPHLFAEATFPQLLTPTTHTLIHFTTIAPTMDAREAALPYAFDAARMADGVNGIRHRGRLFGLWIASLLLALLLAGAAQLSMVYARGATLTDEHAGKLLPERTYNSSADFADLMQQSAEKVHAVRAGHRRGVAAGAAIVLLLCLLRYRFLAWPLHPIGFVMARSMPMQVLWLSILIGWLCKWLVMRLGGVPVYRKLCPLFLGMIVGTTFSSVFWILIKIASYTGGEQGQTVLFLPS